MADGTPFGDPMPHEKEALRTEFLDNGRLIVTGGGDHRVKWWETATQKLVGTSVDCGDVINRISTSPRDKKAVVGTLGGKVLFFDLSTAVK